MTFRTKTILGIAIIEISLLMFLVFSSMSFLSNSNEKLLIQRANSTATMFSHAIKNAVLSRDIATVDALVKDFMNIEGVKYVKVMDQGHVLAQAGDPSLLSRPMQIDKGLSSITDHIFDTRIDISNAGSKYGYIDMGFETSTITMMLDNAKTSIVAIASVEVLLVAIFSFILGTYLSKNLIRLTKAAKTLSKQGPGYQIKSISNDEFGSLATAFNEMSLQLKSSYNDLENARAQAEVACESKGRFLESMSHEIRTPMNGVLGILSLLRETKLEKAQEKLIDTATESGNFLLSIINDILDFTRMDSNTLLLEHQSFDLHKCINSVVDSFIPAAKYKNLVLHCKVSKEVPPLVKGDINRVKQIMHNLIGNSIKFTQHGSITVVVDSKNTDDKHTQITCSVIDTGIGINEEELSYVFDEFTMVNQTYSRTQGGSGLGLAICRRLCELMDGEIKLVSKSEVGSTFTFKINLEIAGSKEQSSKKEDLDVEQDLSQSKILVAEDNKANQLVIQNMLRNIGIEIDIAENGAQAVDKASQYDYDLIFMDISMPEMDGMQACTKIRCQKNTIRSNVPIVALTAHALTGDKEKFLSAGMTDYLSKPVRLNQVINKLSMYVGKCHTDIQEQTRSQVTENKISNSAIDTERSEMNDVAFESDLVDESILKQTIEDTCVEVMPEIIDQYVKESETRLGKIREAADHTDGKTLEFESHTLGSTALALGNRKLSNLARQIEAHCLEQQEKQAFELVPELLSLAESSIQALLERKALGFDSYTRSTE